MTTDSLANQPSMETEIEDKSRVVVKTPFIEASKKKWKKTSAYITDVFNTMGKAQDLIFDDKIE